MFSDDNIVVQLVEEKAQLELKCKELESKLKGKTADENWSIAFTVLGLSSIFGVFLATFFCFQTYRQGYDSAEAKYRKEICANKYPDSVHFFTKCVDKDY